MIRQDHLERHQREDLVRRTLGFGPRSQSAPNQTAQPPTDPHRQQLESIIRGTQPTGSAPVPRPASRRPMPHAQQAVSEPTDWGAFIEAERRGILPPEQATMLAEARSNGLAPIVVDLDGHWVEFPDIESAQQYFNSQGQAGNTPTITMAEIRERFPQYNDLPDEQVLRGFHEQFYGDMSFGDFAGRVQGAQFGDALSPQAPSPSLGGGMSAAATDGALMGFGDEYLAGLSAALGVQPDGEGGANWFDYSRPMGERYSTALDQIRQEQAQFSDERPAASLMGEFGGALMVPGVGARNAMASTTARGRIGQGGLMGAGSAFAYGFGEGEGGFQDRLQSGAMAAPVGLLAGGTLAAAGEGLQRVIQRLRGQPNAAAITPTVEDLRQTANRLYSDAREIGGVVPAQQMSQMATRMREVMRSEGFDPDLHPRVAVALERVTRQAGDTPFSEMEILRRVIRGAGNSLEPDERRLASELVDLLDGEIDNLPVSGTIREARDAWSRLRRMETIEGAIERASLTDNFTQGLRNQFRQILRQMSRNPQRFRGYSDQEIAAIRRVANGTATENGLRLLSRAMSPASLSGNVLTGASVIAGGGLGTLGIPATGALAGRMAGNMTRRATENMRRTVGRAPAEQAIIDALLRRPTPTLPVSVGAAPVVEALMNQ